MCKKVSLQIEPFCALDAVVLSKPRQVLGGLGLFKQLEMAWVCEISLDLVNVPGDCQLAVHKYTKQTGNLP